VVVACGCHLVQWRLVAMLRTRQQLLSNTVHGTNYDVPRPSGPGGATFLICYSERCACLVLFIQVAYRAFQEVQLQGVLLRKATPVGVI